tara:strand:+ start:397 stop:747 length:351 start_codon:yes stop_codon:yes gene_type:complete
MKRIDLVIDKVYNVNSLFETCDSCKKRLEGDDKCFYYSNDYDEQLAADTGALVYCSTLCLSYGTLKLNTQKLLIAMEFNICQEYDEHGNYAPYIPVQYIGEEMEQVKLCSIENIEV